MQIDLKQIEELLKLLRVSGVEYFQHGELKIQLRDELSPLQRALESVDHNVNEELDEQLSPPDGSSSKLANPLLYGYRLKKNTRSK